MPLKISVSEETMRETMDPRMALSRLQKELSIRSHKHNVSPRAPDQWYPVAAGSQK